jgi:hypothetical protein
MVAPFPFSLPFVSLSRTTPIHAILREIPMLFANIDLSHMTPADRWLTTYGALLRLYGILAYPLTIFDIAFGLGCGFGFVNRQSENTTGQKHQKRDGCKPLHANLLKPG